MKKTASFFLARSFIVVLFASSICFDSTIAIASTSFSEPRKLADEDVAALIKPSIVRVAQHVFGTVTIPALTIDVKHQLVKVDKSRPPKVVAIDETLSGSGFVVSSDGHIATNAHVVSLQTIKLDVITEYVLPDVYESALSLSETESKEIFQDENAAFDFSKRVFEYVSDRSDFSVKRSVVVFDPSSQKETFDELVIDGILAETISVNDNFLNDNRDVALIKIDRENVPALSLGYSNDIRVGKRMSIFGFPSSADFNQGNQLESTFTQGVVSAIKDSEKKDFKLFQTDAKVSEGSSGGPLIDSDGRVVGMLTFQSGQQGILSGDTFAFAIPVEIIRDMLDVNHVVRGSVSYEDHFKRGLQFLSERHCVDAIRSFEAAADANILFQTDKAVQVYKDRCRALIDSGLSIDTWYNRLKDAYDRTSLSLRAAFLAVFFFGSSLCFTVWWLIREVRKEEKEIHLLERRLYEEERKTIHEQVMMNEMSKAFDASRDRYEK